MAKPAVDSDRSMSIRGNIAMPNGSPCVADENISKFMTRGQDYVHGRQKGGRFKKESEQKRKGIRDLDCVDVFTLWYLSLLRVALSAE